MNNAHGFPNTAGLQARAACDDERRQARDRAVLRALLGGDLRPGDARRLPRAIVRDQGPPAAPPPRDLADEGFDARAPHGARWGGARAPDERPPFG